MKIAIPSILSAFILLSQATLASDGGAESEGKALYNTHCSSCHGNTGGMDMNKRVAPPIIAVRMHYIGSYPDKDAFVMAIAQSDAEKIAAYIFEGDVEKPDGFDKHFNERHDAN